MRGVDTTLVPQMSTNGDLIYVYSDISGLSFPETGEGEKNRLRDLDSWIKDAGLCPNGYEILKRQSIAIRTWSSAKKVYYFIKCKG